MPKTIKELFQEMLRAVKEKNVAMIDDLSVFGYQEDVLRLNEQLNSEETRKDIERREEQHRKLSGQQNDI